MVHSFSLLVGMKLRECGAASQNMVSHNSEFNGLAAQEEAGKGTIWTRDGLVKALSLKNLKCLRNLPTHQKDVSGVAITDDGSYLVSASYDGCMKLWDMSGYELVKNLSRQREWVRFHALDTASDRAYAGLQSGNIRSVSLGNARNRTELKGQTNFVSCLSIGPPSQYLASRSWDRTLRVWDMDSCEVISSSMYKNGISSVVWHPSGGHIYTTDFTVSLISWKIDLQWKATYLLIYPDINIKISFFIPLETYSLKFLFAGSNFF